MVLAGRSEGVSEAVAKGKERRSDNIGSKSPPQFNAIRSKIWVRHSRSVGDSRGVWQGRGFRFLYVTTFAFNIFSNPHSGTSIPHHFDPSRGGVSQ